MAGGTHADHSNVEALFGMAFTATGKPFTDAQVDAMCVAAELLIDIYLQQYGSSLPTAANTQWRQIVCLVVRNLMDLGDKWDKAGGSTSTTSELGTAAYARYGAKVLTPDVRSLIDMMMAATGGAMAYKDSLDTT
jgi:hypothetical protein